MTASQALVVDSGSGVADDPGDDVDTKAHHVVAQSGDTNQLTERDFENIEDTPK